MRYLTGQSVPQWLATGCLTLTVVGLAVHARAFVHGPNAELAILLLCWIGLFVGMLRRWG